MEDLVTFFCLIALLKKQRDGQRDYYTRNRERLIKRAADNQRINSESRRAYMRNYRKHNLHRIRELSAKWARKNYSENHEKCIQQASEYRARNREKINRYATKKYLDQYRTNPDFRLKASIRNGINKCIGRHKFRPRTKALIGCDYDYLKAHIESQFKPGMTWENRGRTGWHIDHIRPISSFNLKEESELKMCWHFSNLQPLWYWENIKKRDRWEPNVSSR